MLDTFYNSACQKQSEQPKNELCNESEMDEKMKETFANGHTAETENTESLAGSSSRNGLSENNADGNGLQDGNKSDIVDNKQNGFTNETKASQEGDDKKEKNGIEEDKGRYKVEFHLL